MYLSPCFITADMLARGRSEKEETDREHRKEQIESVERLPFDLQHGSTTCRHPVLPVGKLLLIFLFSFPFSSPFPFPSLLFIEKLSPEKKILKG